MDLCGTYTIAKRSPFTREARRLSCDHDDAIEAVRHRADAIFPKLKFGNGRKRTLSQTMGNHIMNMLRKGKMSMAVTSTL